MAQVTEAELLDAQRQLLVAKSEIYRQTMGAELRRLEAATAWVPPTLAALRIVYPALAVAAPLAFWWVGRKRISLGDVAGRVAAGLRMARQLRAWWTALRGRGPAG